MVPVCDKRYHIFNRFRHFWAEIKKLWNYLFPAPARVFMFDFLFSCCCVLTFLSKNTLFVTTFCKRYLNVNVNGGGEGGGVETFIENVDIWHVLPYFY